MIHPLDTLEVFFYTVAVSVVLCLLLIWSLTQSSEVLHNMWLEGGVFNYIFRRVFRTAVALPGIRGKAQEFADKFRADFRKDVTKLRSNEVFSLPDQPMGD